jgi:xanthosine utilization system XapX-like protein
MKIYLISLGAGLLVGVIYGVLEVRSPRRRWWHWSGCWAS